MPLGGNPRAISFWDPVVERISKKLVCWKRGYLSLGGRITLIKGALSNVPIYYMSLYKALAKVVYAIEKYYRDLLWE